MRHALTALCLVFAASAPALARLSVPSLPALAPPGLEAATNLPLRVDAGRLRSLALSVSVASCATNEVLVDVGADGD